MRNHREKCSSTYGGGAETMHRGVGGGNRDGSTNSRTLFTGQFAKDLPFLEVLNSSKETKLRLRWKISLHLQGAQSGLFSSPRFCSPDQPNSARRQEPEEALNSGRRLLQSLPSSLQAALGVRNNSMSPAGGGLGRRNGCPSKQTN